MATAQLSNELAHLIEGVKTDSMRESTQTIGSLIQTIQPLIGTTDWSIRMDVYRGTRNYTTQKSLVEKLGSLFKDDNGT